MTTPSPPCRRSSSRVSQPWVLCEWLYVRHVGRLDGFFPEGLPVEVLVVFMERKCWLCSWRGRGDLGLAGNANSQASRNVAGHLRLLKLRGSLVRWRCRYWPHATIRCPSRGTQYEVGLQLASLSFMYQGKPVVGSLDILIRTLPTSSHGGELSASVPLHPYGASVHLWGIAEALLIAMYGSKSSWGANLLSLLCTSCVPSTHKGSCTTMT